jgi:hypothetical protein
LFLSTNVLDIRIPRQATLWAKKGPAKPLLVLQAAILKDQRLKGMVQALQDHAQHLEARAGGWVGGWMDGEVVWVFMVV